MLLVLVLVAVVRRPWSCVLQIAISARKASGVARAVRTRRQQFCS